MFNHSVEYIHDQKQLALVAERALAAPALALDIETINWWDRESEQVALLQLAFREPDQARVFVVDTLTVRDLEALRRPLELSLSIKAIHNASYDAIRLMRHYQIATSPIHDTMLAARRSGEKKYSLKHQVSTHLGIELDKTEQRSNWGMRPLSTEQLDYASLDAACTLMLYEWQIERGLRGDYALRETTAKQQPSLRWDEQSAELSKASTPQTFAAIEIERAQLALLGVVAELSGRYSPEQLAVSVGAERVGLAGWIMDKTLGSDVDLDETSAKQAVAMLCEQRLIELSFTRRLVVTEAGLQFWQTQQPQR